MHSRPPSSALNFAATVLATASSPPNKNRRMRGPADVSALRDSKISEPAALSLTGMPNSLAIQTIAIPSGGQRSLSSRDFRNSGSVIELTRKFRLGVDNRKGKRPSAASLMRRSAVGRSTASMGRPRTQYTLRDKSPSQRISWLETVAGAIATFASKDLARSLTMWNSPQPARDSSRCTRAIEHPAPRCLYQRSWNTRAASPRPR